MTCSILNIIFFSMLWVHLLCLSIIFFYLQYYLNPVTMSIRLNILQIHFVLLISRQGKVRLTKWYSPYSQKERSKVIRELSGMILTRGPKLCNFVEWRGFKVVYKRYASLYFCMCINQEDNELEVLEIIHHYVEILDRYFGSVCELDLIFNFHKAYYILDEVLIAGELQESSKKTVARLVAAQDSLVEAAKEEANSISNIIAQATK
ncbi:AP-1 complex subunit sigma-1 isoform X1 [Rutidosis leptorrhynchoides]|uniref:AP-1 complex subunit sigma-1 isoform X1 n=1 Tax=Rutidosis leptorrhynchoides TaxID=125765 RepID=UPI003A99AA4C